MWSFNATFIYIHCTQVNHWKAYNAWMYYRDPDVYSFQFSEYFHLHLLPVILGAVRLTYPITFHTNVSVLWVLWYLLWCATVFSNFRYICFKNVYQVYRFLYYLPLQWKPSLFHFVYGLIVACIGIIFTISSQTIV